MIASHSRHGVPETVSPACNRLRNVSKRLDRGITFIEECVDRLAAHSPESVGTTVRIQTAKGESREG